MQVACVIDGERIQPSALHRMPKKLFTFSSLPAALSAQTFIQAGIPYSRSDLAIRLAQAFPSPIIAVISNSGQLRVYDAAAVEAGDLNDLIANATDSIKLVPATTDKTTTFTPTKTGAPVTASTEEVDAFFVDAVVPKRSAISAAAFVDNVANDADFVFSQKGSGLIALVKGEDLNTFDTNTANSAGPMFTANMTAYTGVVSGASAFGE